MTTLSDFLSQLEKLEAAATAGPFISVERNGGSIAREYEIRHNQGVIFRSTSYGRMEQDAAFIAASRSAIPKLVRMVRVLHHRISVNIPIDHRQNEADTKCLQECERIINQEESK